jgi:hypothetical protein
MTPLRFHAFTAVAEPRYQRFHAFTALFIGG